MNCEKYFEKDRQEGPDWEAHRSQCSRCAQEWAFEKAFIEALSERENTPSFLVPQLLSFLERKKGERLYKKIFFYSLSAGGCFLALLLFQGPLETPSIPLSFHFSWDLPPLLVSLVEAFAEKVSGVVSSLLPRLNLPGEGDLAGGISLLWGLLLGLMGPLFMVYGYFLTRRWAKLKEL